MGILLHLRESIRGKPRGGGRPEFGGAFVHTVGAAKMPIGLVFLSGLPQPTGLRLIEHCGNLGTATRMNYTVVGDAVNIAQRLEALGKTLLPDVEVAILISAETAAHLDGAIELRSLGSHELRGREGRSEEFSPVL